MKTNKKIIMTGAALMVFFFAMSAPAGNIRVTKHNLSVSSPGSIAAVSESRICIFCHIPHREGSEMPYLWNRSSPAGPYTPYDSSTLKATIGQPTGSSRMCLSCHDGTIALGAVASPAVEIPFKGGARFLAEERSSHLGTDLSDDHPISFVYDSALSVEKSELRDPALLPPSVKLENDKMLQCISCHDPHDDTFGRFLVMDNTASSLCIACHDINGWHGSAHSQSSALLDRTGGLWPNTDYATIAENGCENCHKPHTAGTNSRLLISAFEEDNCLVCHDGGTASSDIASAITKRYNHPVYEYTGVHDPAEDFSSRNVPKHVECSDCHDAHQANSDPALDASMVSGAVKGASGVSIGGQMVAEARYVYEICFKCHADNNVINALPVTRQIVQLNTRLDFDPANPSFHPVAGPGKNPDVPSLMPPYTSTSTISCTDCHGSSDPSAPRGPHGSDWQYLLTQRYVTDDYTTETPSGYALCYQCHSRTTLLNDESFPHSIHVADQKAPCSACHDPHGVSFTQGNFLRNSHLINFDVSIVMPTQTGRLEFNDQGRFRGECFLNCHGRAHNPENYSQ